MASIGPVFKVRIIEGAKADRQIANAVEVYKESSDGKFRWKDALGDSHSIVSPSFGNTYFVSPDGNDLEGERGNIVDVFKTITAARDKAIVEAVENPLIYVFPGTYRECEIQYEGDYFFCPGAVVHAPKQFNGTDNNCIVSFQRKSITIQIPTYLSFPQASKRDIINVIKDTGKFRVTGCSEAANNKIYTVTDVQPVDASPTGNIEVSIRGIVPTTTVPGTKGRLGTKQDIFIVGTGATAEEPLNQIKPSKMRVFGEGRFIQDATVEQNWAGSIMLAVNGADAFFECHSLLIDSGTAVGTRGDAKLTIRGEFFDVLRAGYAMSFRDTSTTVANFQRITMGDFAAIGYALYYKNGDSSYYSGNSIVEAEEIICGGSCAIIGIGPCDATAKIFLEGADMRQTGTQFALLGNLNVGGEFKINGTLRAQNMGIITGSTNTLYRFTGDFICTATQTTFFSMGTADGVFINGDLRTEGNPTVTQMISQSGGNLRLNGAIINPTGIGVLKSGGTTVIDTLKINASGDSISAASPQTVKVIHSLAASTALNANVSNSITGSVVTIDASVE